MKVLAVAVSLTMTMAIARDAAGDQAVGTIEILKETSCDKSTTKQVKADTAEKDMEMASDQRYYYNNRVAQHEEVERHCPDKYKELLEDTVEQAE